MRWQPAMLPHPPAARARIDWIVLCRSAGGGSLAASAARRFSAANQLGDPPGRPGCVADDGRCSAFGRWPPTTHTSPRIGRGTGNTAGFSLRSPDFCPTDGVHLSLTASAFALESTVTVKSSMPPDAVWKKIGDFCGIKSWIPAVSGCVISADGKQRTVSLKNGGEVVERLDNWDDAKGPSLNKRVARKTRRDGKTQRTTPAKSERIGHCGI